MPEEHEWVIGTVENTHDGIDAPGIAIVCILKGISQDERNALREKGDERAKWFYACDEHGNNEVSYSWETWGAMKYFGQQITAWMPLPDPYKGEEQ